MIRILGEHTDVAGLLADAAEEGRAPVLVDATGAARHTGSDLGSDTGLDKVATLDAFADALGFPDWWGRNLDALADCLDDYAHDLDGDVEVVWDHAAALRAGDPDAADAVTEILTEAEDRHPHLHVTVVER